MWSFWTLSFWTLGPAWQQGLVMRPRRSFRNEEKPEEVPRAGPWGAQSVSHIRCSWNFSIFHNAASIFLSTTESFGKELEFLAGRWVPPFCWWQPEVSVPSFHSCPWRQDGCQGSLLLPPPLPHYNLGVKTGIQNAAERGLISSFASGDWDVYLLWVSHPAG